MSQDKARETTDHQEIRQWVEAREGKPERVKGTGSKEDAGLLRIDFPGELKNNLRKSPGMSFSINLKRKV